MVRFLLPIFLIVCLLQSDAYATNTIDEYEKATIHFHDGTSIFGLAKIIQGYKIKFKVTKNSKADIWTDLMLKGITFHSDYEDYEFEYIYTKKSYVILAQVIEDDYMSLYAKSEVFWSPTLFDSNSMFPSTFGQKKSTIVLYLKRENEKNVTILSALKFKKQAKEYFKDCLGILTKIDSGEFNKNKIPDMVIYYNNFCTE